jgi:hypothetical protein
MSRCRWLPILALAVWMVMVSTGYGQRRPYLGYAYPAGGQQGSTFQVKIGGQYLDDLDQVLLTGEGVTAKVTEYYRKIGPQEITLLREQLKELKGNPKDKKTKVEQDPATKEMIAMIEKRLSEYVNRPACASICSLAFLEINIAADANPGIRELRLTTSTGVSNPLPFHVGQLPEVARKPMRTSDMQVLGKEALALRKRPDEEVEIGITVPCTMNGQIASGEVNRYRFEAKKGQRLVISTAARDLVPFIADAVPGWFQPVLSVYDANGKELLFNDDFRFKPDPLIYFEVPQDGEYVLEITDAIYRGREDFVYRLSIGEVPFVTSVFPLGGRAGDLGSIEMEGWNLEGAQLTLPPPDAGPGVHWITARKDGKVSNAIPLALDELPECLDEESNNDPSAAQRVELPVIVNGRIDARDDQDVFHVRGVAGDTIVAEVVARRLDSPLDSVIKITDESGKILAFNDDYEDAGAGVNTHHADSYLMLKLPADGDYYVHLGDTARNGGSEFAYRLRLSAPRPDFALRVVPSSAVMRSKSAASFNVYAIRKDGFDGDITLQLKNPPEGFSCSKVTLKNNKDMVKLGVRTKLAATEKPVTLTVEGVAKVGDAQLAREAVAAEDRMQAFLWRHLVPAENLQVLVYDPKYKAPPKRVHTPSEEALKLAAEAAKASAEKPKFTKRQVAGRLRQLKLLYEEWLLTDQFYGKKVAECEAIE